MRAGLHTRSSPWAFAQPLAVGVHPLLSRTLWAPFCSGALPYAGLPGFARSGATFRAHLSYWLFHTLLSLLRTCCRLHTQAFRLRARYWEGKPFEHVSLCWCC